MTNLQKQGDKCIAWLRGMAAMGQQTVAATSYNRWRLPDKAPAHQAVNTFLPTSIFQSFYPGDLSCTIPGF
jgi:hypothetical protein